MTFSCDRCGATYSTRQNLREGRVYQAHCQKCGHSIRLTMASRPPLAVMRPRPSPPPAREAAAPAAPAAPGGGMSGELTPPPEGGYYDLVLDDPEPQTPPAPVPGRASEAPAAPASELAGAPGQARILAPAGKPASRHRLGVAAAVAIGSGVAIFGAVGALALKGTQPEEERVSRALLPRAEWATSAGAGAGPSAAVLAEIEEEEQAEPAEPAARPAHPGERTRARVASRRAAAAPVPSRAIGAERAQPVPLPQASLEPAPAEAAPPPPAVASAGPAPAGPVEDAPQFARNGFRNPAPEDPTCVQSSLRVSREMQELLAGPVTVRFAVDRDGSVGLFRVEGRVLDRRVADAIWSAVRGCRFVPGADGQGRPVRLWVVMPLRFVR